MNYVSKFLRSLDWRVLFAVPVLSMLLGVANNQRVPEDQRVRWSGERPTMAIEAKADVERGVWTTDFVSATNEAEKAHLPVVVFAMLQGCPSCARFHQEIQHEKVRAWQKKLGWYFVMTSSDDAVAFVKTTPVRNKKPPYMGVYWSRSDGRRIMRNFTAKSNHMGVPEEASVAQEWMHAVEASVPGAPGTSFAPDRGPGVQISVKVESDRAGRGRVKMSPQVHAIQPGQKVILTAKPRSGSEFAGWRYPDGQIVQGGPQLTLDDQCQAGVYKAIFRRRKSGAPKTNEEEK